MEDGRKTVDRGGYGYVKDESSWVNLGSGPLRLSFNPVVTGVSLAAILGFAVWAIVMPSEASVEFSNWKTWVGNEFTWLYILSQDAWAVFIIIIFCSKYGSLTLGRKGGQPEYNDATWFAMLFACGVSTGLFFYGVAEPIFHYTGKNRYTADPSTPDNTLAQQAMLLTMYHWGLHGWVVYTIVGLLLGIMAHRVGLPLTMKSCFYPLIGDKIFGWVGDLVDILSVIATLFGVCTSLGLGTIQINRGLHLLDSDIPISTNTQLGIIWAITAVATLSVLTGVKYGIRRISELCFGLGLALMFTVLFLDNTVFLLNLYTQSLGYYAQWVVQLGFHTDAWEQLGPGAGGADRGRVLPPGVVTTDGPASWMNDWTIFYWGWWIAWCPFVGMFIAKISVGRTVREFIAGTMAAPVVYVFMWLVIFGGAGMRLEREAAAAGLCCHNIDMNVVQRAAGAGPDGVVVLAGLCGMGEECNPCSEQLATNTTWGKVWGEAGELTDPGSWGTTTPSRHLTRLSCRSTEQMWFDLMLSYGDLGGFLSGFSLLSLVLYFVTSSDSGSLVIDCLASNGHPEPPRLQRLLWALTEGLTASALLTAGGREALTALQAMSIATGLVYTVLMCVACLALWRALQVEAGEADWLSPAFSTNILDPFFTDPFPRQRKKFKGSAALLGEFMLNLVLAPVTVGRTAGRVMDPATALPVRLGLTASFLLFVLLHLLELAVSGCWALALVTYIAFCCGVAGVRCRARAALNIPGTALEDLCLSLVLYPAVALQIDRSTLLYSVAAQEAEQEKVNPAYTTSMETLS